MADRIVVMNRGVIEQVGTPLQVYREPETVFVADFIGTMNFLRGSVAGPSAVQVGELELACPQGAVNGLSEATIAVRPEDIVLQDAPGSGENTIPARVESLVSWDPSYART